MQVREAMNRNAPKIHDNATIKEAAERMALTQAGELVVVAPGDRVLGMLGAEDLLRCLIPEYDELLAEGGSPSRLHPHRRSTDLLPHLKVKEVMRKVDTFLDPEQTLESAFGLLLQSGGKTLPVVSGDRLAGSLSTVDVARSLMWRDHVSPARLQPPQGRRKGDRRKST
ncbi:MAG: CBS domain-containing protein [Actinobacteria bacterium]|jgi:predicted transcriptional regulator|nr:MAG: CBS domain-containing protein [Actinomycetota bacterium]